MSKLTHANLLAKCFGRRTKWPWLCGLLSLLLAPAALATIPLYENDAVLNYSVPGSPPPNIDATNFVNNNSFSVVLDNVSYIVTIDYYEPWNVRNYTNIGYMSVSTDIPLTFFPNPGLYDGVIPTFQFDTQTTNVIPHQMANSFYNSGEIDSGGQLIVWATNIVNPGAVFMGPNSVMQFTGGNVDLTRTLITMEGFGSIFSSIFSGSVGVYSVYAAVGTDTNGDWIPTTNLTPTSAQSSGPPASQLILPNSTPYFHISGLGTSNIITWAVFLEDNSAPSVTHNVYLNSNPSPAGRGADNIEWIGTYVDPVTGATLNNYLYLNDVTEISTNDFISPYGVPDNFTLTSSPTQIFIGTANAPGFPLGFAYPPGAVTNFYSYLNAQLVSTTAATNAGPQNPSGAFTNLPDRIFITANHELDLTLAQITGANYLYLAATNQFDGSAGAAISAPYSDISLGVTNGFLPVTNLLQAALPNWSGTIQAWSGRWILVSTNNITNDFRVLIVNSRVAPTTLSEVQHLTLHATNSVVISDAFNILNSLSIDAQNLTLTTNGYGNGATSIEGELNLVSSAILWPGSLPNLLNLTNNGAIRIGNLANFIGSSNAVAVAPATPAVAATGTLSEANPHFNVAQTNGVTIGANTYVFVNTITNTVPNQVKIAATFDGSMSNLIAAINHTAGSGASYSSATPANSQVTAGQFTNYSFTVTALIPGYYENSIVTSNSPAATNLTWNGQATLSGGIDAFAGTTNISTVSVPYANFINNGLISDLGAAIYANNFENGGTFASTGVNAQGSFVLQSLTTVLTNGSLTADGDISITTGSLLASNLVLQAGRSLTLQVTNQLTDGGVSNGNTWVVGGASLVGLSLPALPNNPTNLGNLLGTTIYCTSPTPNRQVVNTWAGRDRGISVAGYVTNEAVGRLILDGLGANSVFKFQGADLTNDALYVDYLELRDQATNTDSSGNFKALNISSNFNSMVIYYAQAVMNGYSIAEKMNFKNNGRLRWVTNYTGHFSSTNFSYFVGPTLINIVTNAALAQSSDLDSNGDGTPNGSDPTPFGTNGYPAGTTASFPPHQINFTIMTTNLPAQSQSKVQSLANANNGYVPMAVLQWQSVTNATNFVFYKTNLTMTTWLSLTNFVTPASAGSPLVTVTVSDPITNKMRAYRVRVDLKQ